ncbi:hypothetical protein HPS57_02245 [Prevotella sp. PINT]|jgi:hypothetical protein|uniref:hypothetical protein n=1 Tax=Palleniella intestinalis TaxID=2736291 RepID=UPI0015529EE4|nr:hypothetical protein [Palleniella intestinalis]NPD80799.1 hypothetical protein [Palleniella intestinalis]
MQKRIVTKIGNIFCVEIDDKSKRFFQYIANDLTQLNSSVIRVFKRNYPLDSAPSMDEIIDDEVDFYAHTVLSVGIRTSTWYKVGNHKELGNIDNIMFKKFSELSYSHMTKSNNWYIWNISKETVWIGEMTDEYRHLDLGFVFPYSQIVAKIKTGEYTIKILE